MKTALDPRFGIQCVFIFFAILYILTSVRCIFSKYKNERLWRMANMMIHCSLIVFISSVLYASSGEDLKKYLTETSIRPLVTVYTLLFFGFGGATYLYQTFLETDKAKDKRFNPQKTKIN